MKLLFWFIIATATFIVWARYIERHNLYFPTKEISSTPEAINIFYEDVYIRSSDGTKINGWFVSAENPKYTILFCHGNGGNMSHRLEKISLLRDLGLNVFIFDYRGYGRSEGSPSESGIYLDTESAYRYLTEKRGIRNDSIILYGESLGGAVSIDLASRKKVKALITEEAFTSVRDMAKVVYPFIPSFLISSKFDSLAKIQKVNCPKLIIHSVDDEIVPFRLGEKLEKAAGPPKKFLKIRGSHNTAFFDSGSRFIAGIKEFIEEEI